MTLADLIAQFRAEAFDTEEPYFFSDAQITGWLNEAQEEAAIRGRLLHESADDDVCQIAVTAGTSSYDLHASVLEITYARWQKDGSEDWVRLDLQTRTYLDKNRPNWRTTEEQPVDMVQDDTTITLGCLPETDGTLRIECYRLPLVEMADDADSPELMAVHHRQLVHWALHRAFSIPDSETEDEKRSNASEIRFTRYFGPRPDADLKRSTQHDTPHHNALW